MIHQAIKSQILQFFLNLLHKGNIPGRQEFPELKISQIIDLNLPSICNITSQYGRFTIKILSPDFNSTPPHRIQTYDIELGFSNFFLEYIKNLPHQAHNELIQFSQMMFFESYIVAFACEIKMKQFHHHIYPDIQH